MKDKESKVELSYTFRFVSLSDLGRLLKKEKETWLLVEFEGRWATHHQRGEWGTDVWDGSRTGVSERLPSHPHGNVGAVRMDTSPVHGVVVGIYCEQPVSDRCVVFDFVARWKEGFMIMINRNFARL